MSHLPKTFSTSVSPEGSLEVLSQVEMQHLKSMTKGPEHEVLRQCCLAILNAGVVSDDAKTMLATYPDFDIEITHELRGIRIQLINAPVHAFVNGKMIRGIRELISAALRDLIYLQSTLSLRNLQPSDPKANFLLEGSITNHVFNQLRNAHLFQNNFQPLVVCWGGHSVSREEYDYSKSVGYELGLRLFNICTGCGPGAMKGPMKGANVAHAKQRYTPSRFLGITEPGIIAAESPNPMVNELVIMPDIEKRLEAFVRLAHAIIIFPGGVGTAEEILYLLGLLLHPDNKEIPFPIIFTGPKSSHEYFERIDHFIVTTIGEEARKLYHIIYEDPEKVAELVEDEFDKVIAYRRHHEDAFYFNWRLKVPELFQSPFVPTHQSMADINLSRDQPIYELAANLRRVFSGIVAGNVKKQGIEEIDKHGPFQLNAPAWIMQNIDQLLQSFITQQRMSLPGSQYVPCYELKTPMDTSKNLQI